MSSFFRKAKKALSNTGKGLHLKFPSSSDERSRSRSQSGSSRTPTASDRTPAVSDRMSVSGTRSHRSKSKMKELLLSNNRSAD